MNKKVMTREPVLSLPTERTVPVADLGGYSWLIYGREKVGKTDLCSQFPDAFFFLFEQGAKALSIYGRPISTWDEARGYADLLAKTSRFKTIVVDTADLAYKLCEKYECKKLGIDHPSDEEWGKGWGAVRDEFLLWVSKLAGTGRGLIFISHETDKEIKRRTGSSTTRIRPSCPGQARDLLVGLVDIVAYYEYGDDGGRALRIVGDDVVTAGNRLKDNFVGVETIKMGKSAKEGYQNLMAAFNKKGGIVSKKTVRSSL